MGKFRYCAKRRRSRLRLIIALKVEQTIRFSLIAPIISTENRMSTTDFTDFYNLLATESTETQRNSGRVGLGPPLRNIIINRRLTLIYADFYSPRMNTNKHEKRVYLS